MLLSRVLLGVRRWYLQRDVRIYYDPAYRLPLAGMAGSTGMEPRRADFALWYLLDADAIRPGQIRRPRPISLEDMVRVHTAEWLESLTRAETLGRVFATGPAEIPIDELHRSVRLAAGATLGATLSALRKGGISLNLLGGFHHAYRDRGIGFCPINDIAIAIARLRSEKYRGQIAILDLDVHPPDGTADCLAGDPRTWIGSLSGVDWGALTGVDETVLPPGTGDEAYLAALRMLLGRMPRPDLAFVIAGGDILAEDRLGPLSVTLDGARRRDLEVMAALSGVGSVWLPGGGYGEQSWRALAGTGLAIAAHSRLAIPADYDPLAARFAAIGRGLDPAALIDEGEDSDEDLAAMLGLRGSRRNRLLDHFTEHGLEYALHKFGVLPEVTRLGYGTLRLSLDVTGQGDRLRLFGTADGQEHLLMELVVEKRIVAGQTLLFIHWLTLRHPRSSFDERRRKLPGQEVPGLGLAREMGELLSTMAERMGLDGIGYCPAYYHTAYAGRYRCSFVDAERQGRFEALMRDLGHLPLIRVTQAISGGEVLMDDSTYGWEATEMAHLFRQSDEYTERTKRERERVRFRLDERAHPAHPVAG